MPAQTASAQPIAVEPIAPAPSAPAGLAAVLAALPGAQPVLALLYDGRRLVDARWVSAAEVTATLAGSQLAAAAEN